MDRKHWPTNHAIELLMDGLQKVEASSEGSFGVTQTACCEGLW